MFWGITLGYQSLKYVVSKEKFHPNLQKVWKESKGIVNPNCYFVDTQYTKSSWDTAISFVGYF